MNDYRKIYSERPFTEWIKFLKLVRCSNCGFHNRVIHSAGHNLMICNFCDNIKFLNVHNKVLS